MPHQLLSTVQLQKRLYQDLHTIGVLPISPLNGKPKISLIVKPYSKIYYGRFVVKSNKMFVYVFKDKECNNLYSYSHILKTAIHEAIHAKQHNSPNYVRYVGVMHDKQFYDYYNFYTKRAIRLKLLPDEEVKCIG